MTVDAADIVATFPELTGNTRIATRLAMAQRLVNYTEWANKADDGVRYLTAHLVTIDTRAASAGGTTPRGPLTSETVGPLSRSYAAPAAAESGSSSASLGQTTYGQHYLALRSLVFADRVVL